MNLLEVLGSPLSEEVEGTLAQDWNQLRSG
jgi:hypothetical protein